MAHLEQHIAELLHKHNCVIVPDFGGFVANYKSAVVDKLHKKIHPPSKSVLFNSQLTNNDGLLGNYVAQQMKLSYPDALSFIYKGVDGWKQQFEQGGRVELGEIGFLYKENDRVHFEQSREVNLLLQAYGLKSIDFVDFRAKTITTSVVADAVEEKKEVPTIVKEEVVEKVQSEEIVIKEVVAPPKVEERIEEPIAKPIQQPVEESQIVLNQAEEIIQLNEHQTTAESETFPRKRVGLTVLKYAAVAAVVPVLFYAYWIPMETDALETRSVQFSDFNPIHSQNDLAYAQRDSEFEASELENPQSWEELTENINATIYNFELAEDFYVPILLSNSTEEALVDETASNQIVEGKYHVISGCFSVKSNAENLVKDLSSEGYSSAIIDKSGGLHRVSAGGYSSRDAAQKGLDKLRSTGKSGWILKR